MKTPLLGLLVAGSLALGAPVARGDEPVGAQHPPSATLPMRAAPVLPAEDVALLSEKVLTCAEDGPLVVDHGVVLVSGGKIVAVGKQGEVEIPEGYRVHDVGSDWLMPGMIDLHSHIAGTFDINDGVFLTNPGLRANVAVVPENPSLRRALAAGVTGILFIPGSAANITGHGVLLKTGMPTYEGMEVRAPGSMKLAQSGNPERFAWGVARSFMNYHTRETLKRGIAYAERWQRFEAGEGPEPEIDIQFEVFRWLVPRHSQISAHTQIYQVVAESLMMVVEELELPLFIDHGTIGAWKLGPEIARLDVSAALGPRNVDSPSRGFMSWSQNIQYEGWRGTAVGYQDAGVQDIAFNTDAPVMPQEELQLQATVAARHGFRDESMQTILGLTIVPARIANISHRTGSIEVGKDADILQITGHPADPRSAVNRVWIEGHEVYDAEDKREY